MEIPLLQRTINCVQRYLFSSIELLKSMPFFCCLCHVEAISISCRTRNCADVRLELTDRQTHRPSTVTLAAHACRGLITGLTIITIYMYFYHDHYSSYHRYSPYHTAKLILTLLIVLNLVFNLDIQLAI